MAMIPFFIFFLLRDVGDEKNRWIALALFLPWSVVLLPLTGFWFILYTADFLLYDTLNNSFHIEEQIARAYPEQVPFYEDDEAWIRRKQQAENDDAGRTAR